MYRPIEAPPVFCVRSNEQPVARLSLHLLEKQNIGGRVECSLVRGFDKNGEEDVFATIAADEIHEVKGRLGAV